MIQSPQSIRVARHGLEKHAVVAWHREGRYWIVEITSSEFGTLRARESDAFKALCAVREQVEPLGWRVGVAGAQADVWPSGMGRDQGGGLTAYRTPARQGEKIVGTFQPVDPETTTTVAEQRAHIDRVIADLRHSSGENERVAGTPDR